MTNEHKAANRFLNLLRDKRRRDQGWKYLGWLQGGAVGHQPFINAALRAEIDRLLGAEPFHAVGADWWKK